MWMKKIEDDIAKKIIGVIGGGLMYIIMILAISVYINHGRVVQASSELVNPNIPQFSENLQENEDNKQANNQDTENDEHLENSQGMLPEFEDIDYETTTNSSLNNGNTNIQYEEFTTERIEEIEKQISEDLLMSWKPISINTSYSSSDLGIYKPQLSIAKASATVYGNSAVTKGEPIIYVLQVRNDGEEDVTGINISDVIPVQTTLIDGTIFGGRCI